MAEINGESTAPGAGKGSAYVLGANVPSALSVIINGQRSRDMAAHRAAALKLKQDQDAAKELDNSLKYGTKGGALYQPALNSRVFNGLTDKLVDVERQRMAGKLDMYSAKQQQADIKRSAEDEQTLSTAKQTEYQDAYKAVQADGSGPHAGRDATAFNVGYQSSLSRIGADGKQEYLLPSEHDHLAAIQAQQDNPLSYVSDEQIRRSVQGLQQSTLADAHAGLIGGTHGANTLTYKGIVVDRQKDGSFAPRMEGGRPVVDVTQADMERDRGGNHSLDMGIKRMEMNDATLAAAEGRAPKDALTLYKEGLSKYVNFRQTESEGRNAQPHQPKAAGIAGAAPYRETDVAPAVVGGNFKDAPHPFDQALGLSNYTPTNHTFASARHIGAPTITMKNGTVKTRDASQLYSRIIGNEDENGNISFDTNNNKSIDGKYSDAYQLPTDPKTGIAKFPKSAEDEANLYRKGYEARSYVTVHVDKNENFTKQSKQHLAEALAENPPVGLSGHKTYSQLEDEANKAVSKGISRKIIPYNSETQGTINKQAPNYYDQFHKGTVQYRSTIKVAPAVNVPAGKLRIGVAAPAAAVQAGSTQQSNTLKMTGGKKKL